ncbi:AI-2E family transporter [Corynebacterium pacaense]|uniref:AI-2E family transporter n=1 Tax=Corynebacterium pacaense TaxID=1816684 RepID=UPI0009BB6823|nr:AI-2E family transporter [Corynebacterium pacaense]
MKQAENGGPLTLERLRRLGIASWSLLGVIGVIVVLAGGLAALSGILIPLVVAVIIGTVLEPLTEYLVRVRVPRTLAAVIGLLVSILALIGIIAVVIWGFVDQLPEISRQLMQGWNYAVEWARSLELEASSLQRARSTFNDFAPQAGLGLLGFLSSTVYGAISFGIGSFFALFFLFFILRDGRLFPVWLARVSAQDPAAVSQVDSNVRHSLRGYFKGVAVTAVVTAPIFIIPLLILRVPLVIPILILYFFLSFLPFIGAWITGAFAVLIAFGSGGATAALIVSLSLLISNGTIQSAVSSWALGSSLKMHPVLVMLSTLIGGVIAGMLGMVLGAPLLAAVQNSIAGLRATEGTDAETVAGVAAAPDTAAPDTAEGTAPGSGTTGPTTT